MDEPLYSERQAARPDRYSYEIGKELKNRILHTLNQHQPTFGGQYDFQQMLYEVQNELLTRKGTMRAAAGPSANHPAIDHFWICPDNEALDFIELCFRTRSLGFHGDPPHLSTVRLPQA